MKKYLVLSLICLIILTSVGCTTNNKNDEKKLVKNLLVNIYEVSESGEGLYEERSKVFPDDECTNNIKSLFTIGGFEEYKISRTGLKILSRASKLKSTTKLEDLVINKYGKKIGEDTCYEFKGKLRFDYIFGEEFFIKDVNGQVTVGKDEKSGKILIKKINKLSVIDDAEFVHVKDIMGTWKVDKVKGQEKSDEVDAILKMQWIFGEDMLTMKNSETDSSMDVEYIILDKNRIDVFLSDEDDSRRMYEYSIDGDQMTINKYKEEGTLTFKRINN